MQFTKDELDVLLNGPKPLQLARCDLSKAELVGVDLSGADLGEAKLRYANLSKAKTYIKR